jgi:hypothetical protein
MEPLFYHNAFNSELFDRLCAFNLYKSHGLEMACSVYPEQRDFILAHRDQTLEEVRREQYKGLEKNPPHS